MRSPPAESSTAAVHVCRSPAPRNSAPILEFGGTGAAVISAAAAVSLVAEGSEGGDPPLQADVNASSPIISTADVRMPIDLAR